MAAFFMPLVAMSKKSRRIPGPNSRHLIFFAGGKHETLVWWIHPFSQPDLLFVNTAGGIFYKRPETLDLLQALHG